MNKVFLIGRVTKDIELRYTQNNIPVAQFSLAVNRDYKNESGEREVDFINIVVWRKQAEICSKYINKGSQIAVEGMITTRKYEKEGKTRYITEVVAEQIQFLDSKKTEDNPYADMHYKVENEVQNLPF